MIDKRWIGHSPFLSSVRVACESSDFVSTDQERWTNPLASSAASVAPADRITSAIHTGSCRSSRSRWRSNIDPATAAAAARRIIKSIQEAATLLVAAAAEFAHEYR